MGDTFAGRVAGSIVRAAGLSELVATSLDDYKALARDLSRRAAMRERLVVNRSAFPLFDVAKRACDLKRIYVRMAEISRSGTPARPMAAITREVPSCCRNGALQSGELAPSVPGRKVARERTNAGCADCYGE